MTTISEEIQCIYGWLLAWPRNNHQGHLDIRQSSKEPNCTYVRLSDTIYIGAIWRHS